MPARLGAVASHALYTALRSRAEHVSPLLHLDMDGENQPLRVVARPLASDDDREPCVLLSIEEPGLAGPRRPTPLPR